MTGKGRADFRRYGKRLFMWFLMLLCYFGALLAYGGMQEEAAVPVFLSAPCPNQHSVKEILEQEAESDPSISSCFYWDGGIETVTEPVYGRQAKVTAAGILGNAGLYDWRLNHFALEDREGCILDEESALELFGTRDAEGRRLLFRNREYEVRRVIPWTQRMFLFRPDDTACVYTRVFVKYQNRGNRQKTAEQFLMSHGLSGTVVEERILKGISLAVLFALPGAWTVSLGIWLRQKRKQAEAEKKRRWFWTGICAAFYAVVLCAIWRYVRIPTDWLPGRWSDFQFWPAKLQAEAENLRLYLMMAKTVIQTENTIACFRTTVFSVAAFVCYLFSLQKPSFSPQRTT